jgi:Spy/CpxP family protein refolding chaperone
MKTMKAIYFVITACFLFVATVASANVYRGQDIRKLKKELNLTAQQMQQLNSIYTNQQANAKLAAPKAINKENIQKMTEQRFKDRKEVMKVLTPQQRREYRKIMGIKPTQKKKS